MGTRLGDLVERFGGQLAGSPDVEVTAVASLERAGASDISFLSNSKRRAQALHSRAAALILSPSDDDAVAAGYAGARIVTANPHAYFAHAAQYLVRASEAPAAGGIHPTAVVHGTARVDPTACLGPHVTVEAGAVIGAHAVIDAGCYIGRDAVIGEHTHLFANVTFHARCVIGARGIIHSGAVIGGDGFGFAMDDGVYIKIPQVGRVLIGDEVDIGSNTTVDRGALDDTVIEDGVKLDNQIQIGHNCRIGAHTAMAGCVGVAGSAIIGRHCTFGGAAMVNGHIDICDHVDITAGTLVAHSIREPGRYTGYYPITRNAEWERNAALLRNLPAMREKVRALERALKALARGGD
ncbi:UDP-3-O-(3-hydroxymyristoyl)glucosamine N-acyltransferase [Herbaspirillum sp. SJZ107]|uniref:UDP-3-O-(3-hydroxymyristoyl)glucosamine N-acyltransferase n=1 Tax=Herbaspirillum sp. SJZ107 TaxID=2572881 RepID=UPI001153C7BB|nr:UDP-3-O-(3-hydroxymyristoyl)glucosamine N-acyltransferase [Herbaspirillum sp. SJZ107]TQK11482.1 UDP-3-O-[3-hydroxymyristoyl] glucosamine N-acyltransferase [Herbaspirillum sp. SJZ107]